MVPSTFSRVWNLSPATLGEFRREFDNAVEAVSRKPHAEPHRFPLSIYESENQVVLEFDTPGFSDSDLSVSVEDGVMTVSGRREQPQTIGELRHTEQRYGDFSRAIRLHESLDPTSVIAEIDQGVLRLTVSRRVESQPRKVPVVVRPAVPRTSTEAVDEGATNPGA